MPPSREQLGDGDASAASAIAAHNARIGRVAQRATQRFLLLLFPGPLVYLLVQALFRVRVQHAHRVNALGPRVIYAARHFYELDPLLTFYGALWPRALFRPHLVAPSLASQWWFATAVRRAVSWAVGTIIFERGWGTDQGAIDRAAELLGGDTPASVAIYPTGPIGQRKTFTVLDGVGVLAVACEDAQVLPVNVLGIQQLRWQSVLGLRRPEITIIFGEPFRARDIDEPDEQRRIGRICERIELEWEQA